VLGDLPPPQGATLLDVGCGPGEPALTAARMGYEVTAIDLSTVMLDRLSERIAATADKLPIHVRLLDGETLEGVPDASFDVVTSMFGVFVFPHRDAAWQAALRVLKPGGRLLATSWDKSNTNGKMVRYVTQHAVDEREGPAETMLTPSINRTVSADLWRDELQENGFVDVRVHTVSHPLCFKSGEEYVVAVLDNPALAEMVGRKQPDSLRRTMLDFVQLVVDGIDPFSDDAKAAVARAGSGSAENHPLWRRPFTFPSIGNVAVATKPMQ
jgi:ubiquinone/menaquinone biosynthesis C-methylase UbiE